MSIKIIRAWIIQATMYQSLGKLLSMTEEIGSKFHE